MPFKIPPINLLSGGPKTFFYMIEVSKDKNISRNTLLVINSYKNILAIFSYRYLRGYLVVHRLGSPFQT